MTTEERKKLIEDMARKIYEETMSYDYSFDYVKEVVLDAARSALAIAEAAFAKEIEEAYKEGWDDKEDKFHITSFEHTWKTSNARAALLTSTPEQSNDRT